DVNTFSEVPAHKSVLEGIEHVVRLEEQDKDQVADQEYRSPDDGPSQGTFLIPEVHEVPRDIIGLYQGKDDKDPVEHLHAQKVTVGQPPGLDDPQGHFNGGHNGKEDQHPPYFGNVGTELQ